MPGGRSISQEEVTAYIAAWIRAHLADGWDYQRIADHLGVSRTQIYNIKDGSRRAGPVVERNFAAKEFDGSIDALHRAVQEASASEHVRRLEELPTNLKAALQALAVLGSVQDVVMGKVKTIAATAGDDISMGTWVHVVQELAAVERERSASAPALSRPSPQRRGKRTAT